MYINALIIGLIIACAFIFVKFLCQKRRERALSSAHSKYIEQIENIRTHLVKKVKTLEDTVESLSYSNKELTRLNDIKTKFMSIVAHDLRQPLTSVQGYASMLAEEMTNEDDRKVLNNITKATENMNRLMSDLLDAAMMQTGKMQMNFKPFIYNELVDEVFCQYRIIAKQRNIIFRKVEFPMPILVTADRFRVNQILSNLINNAFKFTPAGGVVEIRYIKEEDHVRTMVNDSGSGLVHLERIKIFEKFQQSEALTEEIRKLGWGLGLSIAQDIIAAHNGAIGADSAGLGKGSAFWFILPLEQQQAADKKEEEAKKPAKSKEN